MSALRPAPEGTSSLTPGLATRREAELSAANEGLVLATLTAQGLQLLAVEALRRQTEALALAAHELRNPLAPILTVASLLGTVTNMDALPQLSAILTRQVAHMVRLVDDLLDASRVATGKLHLRHRPVPLHEAIVQAIDTCRPAFDTRHQRFVFHVPDEPMVLEGDAVRLAQVFTNLLHNASKYTLTGGDIVLTCVMGQSNGRPTAVVTVSDNGIGISAEALPLIFEPFVQDEHAIGFAKDGLGIGLTLVREIVEAHAGSVVAESAGSGQGSRFVVALPLA